MDKVENIVNNAFDKFTKIDLFLALDEFLNRSIQGDTIKNMFRDFINCMEEGSGMSVLSNILGEDFQDISSKALSLVKLSEKNFVYLCEKDANISNIIDDIDVHPTQFLVALQEHVIGLIIRKIKDDNYEITLCNSGYAGHLHGFDKNDIKCLYSILVFENVSKKK